MISTLRAQETITLDIFFDTGVSALNEIQEQELYDLHLQLNSYSDYYVSVVGHTDQVGSYEYNNKLAKARAESVEDMLISQGVSALQLSYDWKGESELRALDNSEKSKQQNRRVEIVATCFSLESVEQLTDYLLPEQNQYHTLNNTLAQTIKLAQGTEIDIPEQAFVYADTGLAPTGPVTLIAKEVFSYSEIINNDWHTSSGGELLETAGMIELRAISDGRELAIKDGKSLDIAIPTETNQEGMQLFDGQVDSTTNEWVVSDNTLSISKEELNPVKIDLSPIFNFDLGEFKKPTTPRFDKMPSYPAKRLRPNPPSKTLYSEAKYQELMKSYEQNVIAYDAFVENRDTLLAEWNKEIDTRLQWIHNYKSELRAIQTKIKAKSAIAKVYKQQDEVSHDDLLFDLQQALDAPIKISGYNKRKLVLKALQGSAKRAIEERNISFTLDTAAHNPMKSGEFYSLVTGLKAKASYKRQIENGKDDRATKLKYVFAASNLGWFNCDRFRQIASEDKRVLGVERTKEELVFLLFKDFRGLLRFEKLDENMAIFKNIPKESNITVIGIKLSENAKPMLAVKDMTLVEDDKIALTYKQSTLAEIKNSLIVGDPFSRG